MSKWGGAVVEEEAGDEIPRENKREPRKIYLFNDLEAAEAHGDVELALLGLLYERMKGISDETVEQRVSIDGDDH